ncbi:Mitochondrial distribution and morphology protein 12 [Rhodotorula kratochvilovae]
MSIDLEWSALDAQLTLACTHFLSAAFAAAPRPDFLGPLAVTAFSFGDAQPDITLDDIRDIQHEFIDSSPDDDDDLDLAPSTQDDPLPPSFHARTFPGSPTASVNRLASSSGAALFSPGLLHHSSFPAQAGLGTGFAGGGAAHARSGSRSRSHSPAPRAAHFAHPSHGAAYPHPLAHAHAHPTDGHSHSHTHPHSYTPPSPTPSATSLPPLRPPSSAPSPSFQVHLRISYTGNLSLGLSTALRINYPSAGFMSLPLSLTLTGLALEGTLVVAFEGGRRRVHLSLLDPGDPVPGPGESPGKPRAAGGAAGTGGKTTPGARVLRAAHVESEVGQADKHVLRNVGKVEKFVLEVARKTLENELVFPNFQTIVF